MSLADVRSGARVRILEVQGGRRISARLASMCIYPGVEAEVTAAHRGGPVVIRVAGSRIVIGCGMVDRVLVEPVPAAIGRDGEPAADR